jgi:uncharacterized spore protein YtfJ
MSSEFYRKSKRKRGGGGGGGGGRKRGNDLVIEEEKCRVRTYQDAVKSLKELQEFSVQRNDSDMLSRMQQDAEI